MNRFRHIHVVGVGGSREWSHEEPLFLTDTTKNITFPQTTYAGSKITEEALKKRMKDNLIIIMITMTTNLIMIMATK